MVAPRVRGEVHRHHDRHRRQRARRCGQERRVRRALREREDRAGRGLDDRLRQGPMLGAAPAMAPHHDEVGGEQGGDLQEPQVDRAPGQLRLPRQSGGKMGQELAQLALRVPVLRLAGRPPLFGPHPGDRQAGGRTRIEVVLEHEPRSEPAAKGHPQVHGPVRERSQIDGAKHGAEVHDILLQDRPPGLVIRRGPDPRCQRARSGSTPPRQ